jgi:glutamyl endopeptidase
MNALRTREFAAELDVHAPLENTATVILSPTETRIKPSKMGSAVQAAPLEGEKEVIAKDGLEGTGALETSRPHDIAVATFGPPPARSEVIIGTDDRVRVPDTTGFPYSATASLQIIAPDGELYVGTAWFVSSHTLVTAGHCVFVHDRAGRFADWAREIRVIPGRNGSLAPFGSAVSTTFRTVAGWARDRDPQFDYGVIDIPLPLGETVGSFGYGVLGDEQLVGREANISGYPGDKQGAEDGTQWYDSKVIMSVDTQRIHYEIDTVGGQSGSAVWIGHEGDRVAIGIHAYGDSYFGNSATRITPPVFENILAWRR